MADAPRDERVAYRRIAILLHVIFVVATLVAVAISAAITAAVIAAALGAAIFGGWAVGLLRAEQAVRLREVEVSRIGRPVSTQGWATERPQGPRPSTSLPTIPPTAGPVVAPRSGDDR